MKSCFITSLVAVLQQPQESPCASSCNFRGKSRRILMEELLLSLEGGMPTRCFYGFAVRAAKRQWRLPTDKQCGILLLKRWSASRAVAGLPKNAVFFSRSQSIQSIFQTRATTTLSFLSSFRPLLSCFSSFFLAPLDYLKLNYDLPSCLSSSSSSRAKRLKPRLEKLETAFRLLWRPWWKKKTINFYEL